MRRLGPPKRIGTVSKPETRSRTCSSPRTGLAARGWAATLNNRCDMRTGGHAIMQTPHGAAHP